MERMLPPSLEAGIVTPWEPESKPPKRTLNVEGLEFTWTPKVCRMTDFWAVFRGLGPLFYILLGFRYFQPIDTLDLKTEKSLTSIHPFLDVAGGASCRVAEGGRRGLLR